MKFSFFTSATIFAAAFLPAALANKDATHLNLGQLDADADAEIKSVIENMVDIHVVEPRIPITASTSDREDEGDEHRQRGLLRGHHGHVDANHDERLLVEENQENCDAETGSDLRVTVSTDANGRGFDGKIQERTENGVGDLIFAQKGGQPGSTFDYNECLDADKCYKLTFVDTGKDGSYSDAYGFDVVNNGFTMMSARDSTPKLRGETIVYVGKCETVTFNVVGGRMAMRHWLRALFVEQGPDPIIVLNRRINNGETFSQNFEIDVSRCYHAMVQHYPGRRVLASASIVQGGSVSSFGTALRRMSQQIEVGNCPT